MSEHKMESEIIKFYKNKKIFITGGTGFVGKVLIEKLLRICYDIDKIYVLVRQKRGKTEQQRFQEMFNFVCFDNMKKLRPNFHEKIHLINGDCSKKNLNLSSADYEFIRQNVNIVIHAAADVNFELTLRDACNNNVRGISDLLQLAHQMPQLKAFVFVSTAYSNCPHSQIKEEFYKPPLKANQLLDLVETLDDVSLKSITPGLLQKFPNTYTFSKSIAEDLVKDNAGQLPIVIIRPSMVVSSDVEPISGWIDNFYSVIGLTCGFSIGAIKTLYMKKDLAVNCIPCDYVVANILAATWDIADQKSKNNKMSPVIYNSATKPKDTPTMDLIFENFYKNMWDTSSALLISYPYCIRTDNFYLHKILNILLHAVPANIVDFIMLCLRKKPIAVKKYEKMKKQVELSSFFMLNEWTFDVNNTDKLLSKMSPIDKELFQCDMNGFDWNDFIRRSLLGIRYFLFKDPPETKQIARIKLCLHAIFHFCVLIPLVIYLVYKLIFVVLKTIF